MANNQDWTPLVFTKSFAELKKIKTPQDLQRENIVVTKKKSDVKNPNPSVNIKKIEQNDEDYKIPYVSSETANAIIAGRREKKWTQEKLANETSLPIATIKSIESCNEVVNKQQLQKIANKLGIKL